MQLKPKGRKIKNQKALDLIKECGKKPCFMTKRVWKLKRPPGSYILRKRLNAEYEVRSLSDETGWIIVKIK